MNIHFGSTSEYVRIAVPRSFSDEGWAETDVEVSVQGFVGKIRVWLENDDFELFLPQLRSMYDTLKGQAEMNPCEGQFVLKLTATRGGHVEVSGEAWAFATHGSCLKFEFELDQSFLPGPIAELEALLNAA